MMDGMMACGGWGMMGFGILTTILIVLAIAALAKYLFWSKG
jgi:hypothetical protein